MHDDLLDAIDWAVKEKITTADKVAIYGGSYGGYATLVGLTFTPDTFACGVDIVGPSNLDTLLASIPAVLEELLRGVRDCASAIRAPKRARSCWPSARRSRTSPPSRSRC